MVGVVSISFQLDEHCGKYRRRKKEPIHTSSLPREHNLFRNSDNYDL